MLKGFSEPYKDNEDNGWIDIISKNPLMIFYLPEKKNLIFTAKLCSEYYSDADNAKKGLNIIINGNLVNANIDGACGKVEYNVTADLTKKGLNKFEFLFEHNIIKYKTRIAYLSFKPI